MIKLIAWPLFVALIAIGLWALKPSGECTKWYEWDQAIGGNAKSLSPRHFKTCVERREG